MRREDGSGSRSPAPSSPAFGGGSADGASRDRLRRLDGRATGQADAALLPAARLGGSWAPTVGARWSPRWPRSWQQAGSATSTQPLGRSACWPACRPSCRKAGGAKPREPGPGQGRDRRHDQQPCPAPDPPSRRSRRPCRTGARGHRPSGSIDCARHVRAAWAGPTAIAPPSSPALRAGACPIRSAAKRRSTSLGRISATSCGTELHRR